MPGWAIPPQSWLPDVAGKFGGENAILKSKRDGDEAGEPCTERDRWLLTALKWP